MLYNDMLVLLALKAKCEELGYLAYLSPATGSVVAKGGTTFVVVTSLDELPVPYIVEVPF
jgi:hypothetical protein